MSRQFIHLDCGYDGDPLCPIPPVSFMSSMAACVHTPDPTGYSQWHEWAELASKTHEQIRCPRCGLWAIWLPKAIARPINRQSAKDDREFARLYKKHFLAQRIEDANRELENL